MQTFYDIPSILCVCVCECKEKPGQMSQMLIGKRKERKKNNETPNDSDTVCECVNLMNK